MGTFDGWSQGEHLSPEYTGSFTKFSTTLMLRPGRYHSTGSLSFFFFFFIIIIIILCCEGTKSSSWWMESGIFPQNILPLERD